MTVDFYDLFTKPQPERPAVATIHPIDPARATRYAAKALEAEATGVAEAPEGQRNHTLNRAAFNLAQLVAAGHLDHHDTWAALAQAARTAGLDEHEIRATLTSGFKAGTDSPRVVPDLPPVPDPTILTVPPGVVAAAPDSEEVMHATWAPIDLTAVLNGTYTPELPALMPRTDGHNLLYPGRIHSFHGESESGKSLVAQAEAARLVRDGHDVLYIDFEADHASVTGRLLELGATPRDVLTRFRYVRPEVDPRRFDHEREAITRLLDQPYTLAVIDGVTDALGIFGQSTKDNDDIAAFMRLVPRTVARKTGAAVVLIDHVSKDAESRGRFAIGGQAKMASLDGAAYVVEVTEALGRGRRGIVTLRVGKDRPGGVRAHAGTFRKLDRTQEAARVVVDSTDGDHIDVTVEAPRSVDEHGDDTAEFRPSGVMEKVSRWLEKADEAMPIGTIAEGVGGKKETVRTALAILVRDHFVKVSEGARGAKMHSSIQPYREAADRLSDRYVPVPTTLSERPGPTRSRPGPGPGETTRSQSRPPYGDGTGSTADETTSPGPGPTGPGQPPVDVACGRCFRPVPAPVAETTGGRCTTCFTYGDGEVR